MDILQDLLDKSHPLNNGDFLLRDAGPMQKKVLDTLRLTDEFRTLYGSFLLDRYPKGIAVREAVEAIQKFHGISQVDPKKYRDLIIDLIYTRNVLDFKMWEYFSYGLQDKTIRERLEFISNKDIFLYYKALNTKSMGTKWTTYVRFKDYYKRDVIRVRGEEDKSALAAFSARHPRFLIKTVGSSMGKGVRIVETKDYANVDQLYEAIAAPKTVLCEELIVQSKEFRRIHPASVNTVRVFTYFNGKDTTIVGSFMRAGRGSAVVDNAGAGGVLTYVDCEKGIVTTDAADEMGRTYPTHPDTGFVFKGFQIPRWAELTAMLKEMAPMWPEVPMVGWDIALSEEKGWQIIEGNQMGQLNLLQIPTKKGLRKDLTQRFEWEKHRAKLKQE